MSKPEPTLLRCLPDITVNHMTHDGDSLVDGYLVVAGDALVSLWPAPGGEGFLYERVAIGPDDGTLDYLGCGNIQCDVSRRGLAEALAIAAPAPRNGRGGGQATVIAEATCQLADTDLGGIAGALRLGIDELTWRIREAGGPDVTQAAKADDGDDGAETDEKATGANEAAGDATGDDSQTRDGDGDEGAWDGETDASKADAEPAEGSLGTGAAGEEPADGNADATGGEKDASAPRPSLGFSVPDADGRPIMVGSTIVIGGSGNPRSVVGVAENSFHGPMLMLDDPIQGQWVCADSSLIRVVAEKDAALLEMFIAIRNGRMSADDFLSTMHGGQGEDGGD